MLRRHGEFLFTRLVASGTNTNPWLTEAHDKIVQPGDLVGVDTDANGYEGYVIDVSRTFLCGDDPSPGQKEAYRVAYDCVTGMVELVRPGMTFAEFAAQAPKLPEAYRAMRYPGMVHQAGLEDEGPGIPYVDDDRGPRRILPQRELKENMVLNLECYAGKVGAPYGVKLEDQVVVTASGVRAPLHLPVRREAPELSARSRARQRERQEARRLGPPDHRPDRVVVGVPHRDEAGHPALGQDRAARRVRRHAEEQRRWSRARSDASRPRATTTGGMGLGPIVAIVRRATSSSGRRAVSSSSTVLSMPDASTVPSSTIWIERLVRARRDHAAEVATRLAEREQVVPHHVVPGVRAVVVVGPGATPEIGEGPGRVVAPDDDVGEVHGPPAVPRRGHHGARTGARSAGPGDRGAREYGSPQMNATSICPPSSSSQGPPARSSDGMPRRSPR